MSGHDRVSSCQSDLLSNSKTNRNWGPRRLAFGASDLARQRGQGRSVRSGVCIEWVRLPAGHRQMPIPSRVGIAVAVVGNPGAFGEIVSCDPNSHVKVNEEEIVKIIALS